MDAARRLAASHEPALTLTARTAHPLPIAERPPAHRTCRRSQPAHPLQSPRRLRSVPRQRTLAHTARPPVRARIAVARSAARRPQATARQMIQTYHPNRARWPVPREPEAPAALPPPLRYEDPGCSRPAPGSRQRGLHRRARCRARTSAGNGSAARAASSRAPELRSTCARLPQAPPRRTASASGCCGGAFSDAGTGSPSAAGFGCSGFAAAGSAQPAVEDRTFPYCACVAWVLYPQRLSPAAETAWAGWPDATR